jgi:hypothetical protein
LLLNCRSVLTREQHLYTEILPEGKEGERDEENRKGETFFSSLSPGQSCIGKHFYLIILDFFQPFFPNIGENSYE